MRRSIAISAKPGTLCHRRDACIYCVLRTLKKISINLILMPWAPEVGSQELSRQLLQLPIRLLKFQRNGRNLSQSTRSGRITHNSTLRVCLINVLSHIFHVLWESRENCCEEPICSCVLNYAFSVRGGKAFRQRLQLPSQRRRPRVCSKQLNPRRGAGSQGGLSGHLSLWMGGQVKPSDSSASPPASLLLKRA